MKKILLSILWCLIVCSCQKTSAVGNKEYADAYQNALNSEIIETKLLSDFRIGMTENQVDSVVKSLYHNGKLIYWDDINTEYVPIRDESEYAIGLSYYVFSNQGKEYYLSMHPDYKNGKLSRMFCTIKNKTGQKINKPLHIIFSEIFENTERGKSFRKFIVPMINENGVPTSSQAIFFIKDNLEISFYPQIDTQEGTMQYRNIPDRQNDKELNSSNEL